MFFGHRINSHLNELACASSVRVSKFPDNWHRESHPSPAALVASQSQSQRPEDGFLKSRITSIATAILCLAGAATALPTPKPATIVAEREGVRVVMGAGNGAHMTVDGIPFLNQSTLFCVKENWNGRWFGYQDDRQAVSRSTHEKTADGGDLFTVGLRSSTDDVFQATQTLELLPGRVARVGLEALVTTSSVAILEHMIGGMNPVWVAGREFRVSGKDARTSYTVAPTVPRQADMLDAALAANFDTMTIETRMGPLQIIAKGDVKPCVLDYRAHKYHQLTPNYWIGILATNMSKDKPLKYTIEFRFPPARDLGGPETNITADLTPGAEADVLQPAVEKDRVFPTPKKIGWSGENFPLNAETSIRLEAEGELAASAEPALAGFANFLKRGFDLAPARTEKESGNQIVFVCKPGAVDVVKDNDEQYTVKVGDTVVCAANTTAGLMNAVKTLQQLVRNQGGKVFIRGCEVEDYPALPYRGIHFFSGKDARELQLKMVRDILGALKINNIVYQCEYVMWEATRKAHHEKYGMTKDDARAVVEECERQGIEITPLINTFGHSEWLIANDAYRHLADNPEQPYAYDPSNPEVYKLTDRIHEEVLEFFKPRVLHIGHDEITFEGFPHREANKKVGVTELIMRDIKHHYEFLKARGVRTMLWGDMFLAPGEAPGAAHAESKESSKARRDALPKDVIIADWHYGPNPVEGFISMKLFNDEGFDVLACPWFDPVNVVNFTRAAKLQYDATKHLTGEPGQRKGKTYGILDTTWAGYSFGQESFDESQDQYAAYFLAAEAAWTGAEKSFEEMDLDYRAEFARMWSGSDLPNDKRNGWTVDLDSVATFPVSADGNGDWLGHHASGGMEKLPVGKARLGRFTYQIAGGQGAPRAVLLASRMNPEGKWPRSLTIPVDRPAEAISFATAATLPGPAHPPIATTTVTFDDGTTQSFAWKLGQTVFAVDDLRASATSPVVWKDAPKGKMPKAVHQYVWRNPDPQKKIKSVRFDTNTQAGALMLFGMSGILPE